MYTTIFSLAAVASFAAAQSTAAQSTVNIWIPGSRTRPQNVIASVISNNTVATVYAIQCKEGAAATDCEIPGGLILTEGPGQAAFTSFSPQDNKTTTATCKLKGTTAATCISSFSRSNMGDTRFGTLIEYFTSSQVAFTDVPLIDKVTVTTLPPDPNAPTRTFGDDIFTKYSESTSKSSSSTASSSSTTAAVTSSSTAGMAMITANAQWVVGGVAAGFALL